MVACGIFTRGGRVENSQISKQHPARVAWRRMCRHAPLGVEWRHLCIDKKPCMMGHPKPKTFMASNVTFPKPWTLNSLAGKQVSINPGFTTDCCYPENLPLWRRILHHLAYWGLVGNMGILDIGVIYGLYSLVHH